MKKTTLAHLKRIVSQMKPGDIQTFVSYGKDGRSTQGVSVTLTRDQIIPYFKEQYP